MAKEHSRIKEVKIAVLNEAGDISYHPAVLHVSRRDVIRWTCESGPFTVSFHEGSPLEEGAQLRSAAETQLVGTVSEKAERGVHYYAVAASFRGKIYLDTGCPEVIVD